MEILVVTSKVKAFLKAKKMNTSGSVPAELTGHLENILSRAAVEAEMNGRVTVMEKDIKTVLEKIAKGE